MAGLLNMGGFGGAHPAGLMQFPGFDPKVQRNAMLKNGLLQMGISLLGQGPSQYPIGFGQSIAQGLGAGASGARDARVDYQKQGLLSYEMAEMQRKREAEDQERRDRDAWIGSLDPQQQSLARVAPNAVAGAQASTFYQKPAKPPTSFQEFDRAQTDPAYAGFLKSRTPQTTITNSVGGESSADDKMRSELSKAQGTQWSEMVQQGSVAGSMIQDLEVMDELAKIAPQGPVTGRLAEMFPGFSAAGDAFESVAKRVAPSLRTPGSGSTSDVEYEGFLKAMPRLRNTEGGNEIISAVLSQKARLNVERAQIVTAYMNEEISAKQARSQLLEVNKRSILSPELKAIIDRASGADLKEKYGLE
jgi:hypothetical protein